MNLRNSMEYKFWKNYLNYHSIITEDRNDHANSLQLQSSIKTFFNEMEKSKYSPRSVLVDTKPIVIDQEFEGLLNPNNCGVGKKWAKPHNRRGSTVSETIMEVIWRESEEVKNLDVIQHMYSLSGGNGSGICSILLRKILDEY